MSIDTIKSILEKFESGDCSEAELQRLKEWYMSFEWTDAGAQVAGTHLEAIKQRAWNAIQDEMEAEPAGVVRRKLVRMPRHWWGAVAAAVVLFLGIYFVYQYTDKANIGGDSGGMAETNDAAPGGNRAVLTLADGSTIILDSAANGRLASQGNIKVIKLAGQLSYAGGGEGKAGEVLYNTITTPRGGQYQLVLADGTKIWLNAASSLRFPASFSGKERRVELTGEGYFEVAKNAAMPFKVDVAGRGEIKVLGTHFNVNAYEDEGVMKTTLLEGSVMVSGENNHAVIVPGEQAVTRNISEEIVVQKDIDLEEVVAWKNGLFQFNQASIETVMRQVARWYDLDVVFKGAIPNTLFAGKISRQSNASTVLKVLAESGIHFKIKDKNIIVSP